MTYEEYIQSDEWSARRSDYFSRHRRSCRACGKRSEIHLHHHTYERLFNEIDSDLVALCDGCHKNVHDIHNSDRSVSLTEVTFSFIEKRRSKRRSVERKRRKSEKPYFSRPAQSTKKDSTPPGICCYCGSSFRPSGGKQKYKHKDYEIHVMCRNLIMAKSKDAKGRR